MSKKQYRAVIYTKIVLVEENQKELFRYVHEALDELEASSSMYGWSDSQIADDENVLPEFEDLPPEYEKVG